MGNEKRDYLEAKKLAEQEQKKKQKKKSILTGICVILAVVLMVGVISYKSMLESGFFLRRETAAQSENFEVDGTMMAYYFQTRYQQFYSYASYMGIDTTKSLKNQASIYGGTWFDYFMNMTEEYVTELLSLCEAAKAANVTLDEKDLESIDATIDEMKTYAKLYGYSLKQYIAANFGSGINEKDIRKALELDALGVKYAAEYQESLSYTKDECEAYYAENVDDFDSVDLLKFTVSRADFVEEDEEGNPTGDMEAARKEAEDYANKLAGAPDADTFKGLVKEYIINVEGEEEDHAAEHLDEIVYDDVLKTSTSHDEDALEWAFTAKANETKIVSKDDSTAKDVLFNVYYLVSEAGRDETLTRDIRHILFLTDSYADEAAAKAKAEEVYAEWEAAGFTEEKFLELNTKYNGDTGSVENGGLYEKVSPGDMVVEFDEWLFAEERAAGDHGLVESADYGWHIMNYVGENEVAVWQADAEDALRVEDFEALVDKYDESIVIHNETLGHIPA